MTMTKRASRWVAVVTMTAFANMGCYNTYFISKDELEKLESGVEIKEVVTVAADCKTGGSVAEGSGTEAGPKLAKADESSEDEETATDAAPAKADGEKSGDENGEKAAKAGCKSVPVSTSNAINVVTNEGNKRRVTPFNFMMSEQQLVAPEYDLLLSLDNVKGAKVREFSTWKTIGTIAAVSAVSIGSFIGISIASPEPEDF